MKKLFTSKILLAFVAIGACATLSAQTVIKVGAGQGDKQKTIQMAYDSIVPATVAGAYVLELQSDYDPQTEIYPITFTAKTGASEANTITITPATGVKKIISAPDSTIIFDNLVFASGDNVINVSSIDGIKNGMAVYGVGLSFLSNPYRFNSVVSVEPGKITLTSPATATYTPDRKTFVGKSDTKTIVFDGAKYIIIDGVSRTGNTGLEICNPNSISAQAIYFKNNATYNTIKNCIVRGANVSGQINNGFAGTIYFMGGQYNTITDNDVCDMNDPNIPFPICPFQMTAAGGANNNNKVLNNNIYNISNLHSANGPFTFMQFGSEGSSANNWVLNNRFYWTTATSITGNIIPINIGSLSSGNRFENNVIGYGAADGTGISTVISNNGTWGTGNGMRYFTCKNNIMAGINYTGTGFRGFSASVSSASYAADDIMNGNTVKDIVFTAVENDKYLEGIYLSGNLATAVNVKNNTVSNIQIVGSNPDIKCTAYGIRQYGTGANAFSYSGNKVMGVVAGESNSTTANAAYGIYVTANTKSVVSNLITDVTANSGNTSAFVRGLQTSGSTSAGQLIANNIVRIGTTVGSDVSITAFHQDAATSDADICKIYNNTLYIGGTAPATATKSSVGFLHAGLAPKNDLKNNIIANKRTVGNTEAHYALQIKIISEINSSDYNMYQFGKFFGKIDVDDASNLADWADALSTPPTIIFDAHSVVADPQFEDANAVMPDMRIKATSPAKGAGVALTDVTTDFNGFARTTMDMGALAYGTVSAIETVKPSSIGVYGADKAIVVKDMMGQNARIYTLNGQLVKSAQLLSDKESISVANGLYIVRVGSFSSKVLVK